MIMEAIRQGVSEERIAKTLAVDVAAIRRKRDLCASPPILWFKQAEP